MNIDKNKIYVITQKIIYGNSAAKKKFIYHDNSFIYSLDTNLDIIKSYNSIDELLNIYVYDNIKDNYIINKY